MQILIANHFLDSILMYTNLRQPIEHIPEELAIILIECEKCQSRYSPEWLEMTSEPQIPVKSIHGGIWRMKAKLTACPHCQHINLFEIPQKTIEATYELFGDEAFREIDGKLVLTYTLVGINRRMLNILNDKIRIYKESIFPNKNPEDWTLHMTTMWSSGSRKHSIFREFTYGDISKFVDQFFQIVREIENGFVIYNISAIGTIPNGNLDKKILNERKTEIYSLLILYVIKHLTSNKIVPVFTFDADKVVKEESVIQEWASRSFQGSQHSLLYSYLTGSYPIEEPKFVKPGSNSGLEVADFISYVIARYCFRRLSNASIDLDPHKLGMVHYLGFENGWDFIWAHQENYPWEVFYEAR